MSVLNYQPRGFTHFAIIGIVLAVIFAYGSKIQDYEEAFNSIWQILSESDLGNAIAALVAVGGYLLETYNSRRAQQLEAQIARVSSQSHDLLVPITTQFHSMWMGSTLAFIDKHIQTVLDNIEISTDGDDTTEEAKQCQAIFEQAMSHPFLSTPTELTNPISVALLVTKAVISTTSNGPGQMRTLVPYELPDVLHNAVKKSSNSQSSTLWKDYEAFIRHEFVPAVQRIADIIDEFGNLMEPIPMSKLEEMFGSDNCGQGWKWTMAPRMWFYSMWLAYARGWQTVISKWDNGDYNEIRPSVRFPIGLLFFNIEAQSIVANVEKELVGMSQMHGHSQSHVGGRS